MQPFRIEPAMPSQAYKTYQIVAPPSTHFRRATCAEVECQNRERGWKTVIDTGSELGAKQANYIRLHSGKHYTANPVGPDSTVYEFVFPGGQDCFTQHQVRLDRPETFLVRHGDWRQSSVSRRHVNADDWVDDFANHQDKIATEIERG